MIVLMLLSLVIFNWHVAAPLLAGICGVLALYARRAAATVSRLYNQYGRPLVFVVSLLAMLAWGCLRRGARRMKRSATRAVRQRMARLRGGAAATSPVTAARAKPMQMPNDVDWSAWAASPGGSASGSAASPGGSANNGGDPTAACVGACDGGCDWGIATPELLPSPSVDNASAASGLSADADVRLPSPIDN
jgi:hypothetical protein